MSRTVKDVLNDFRKSIGDGQALVVVDWDELESRINYYIQTEVQRPARLDEAKWWEYRVSLLYQLDRKDSIEAMESLRVDGIKRIAALEHEGVKA